MTTKYTEWLQAYDQGKFKPNSKLGVMLVYKDYTPDPSHTIADVQTVIATIPHAMNWAQFQANGMGWIEEHLTTNCKTFLKLNKELSKDKVKALPNAEVLTELFDQDEIDFKDTGIKYVVVFWGDKLCFCEPIEN